MYFYLGRGSGGSSVASTSKQRKRPSAFQRSLDLEEKKLKMYENRERNREYENDEDMLFLKSLYPYMKKTVDKLTLRCDILTLIKDHLKSEELLGLTGV